MNGWEVVGVGLQLIGTLIAGWALWKDWQAHSQGQPLVPAVSRAEVFLRRLFGRPRSQTVTPDTIRSQASAARPLLTVNTSVDADAPLEDQVDYIRQLLGGVQAQVWQQEKRVTRVQQDLDGRLSELDARSRERDAELKETVTEVATGSVRRELLGLVLVGIGSIIGAVG